MMCDGANRMFKAICWAEDHISTVIGWADSEYSTHLLQHRQWALSPGSRTDASWLWESRGAQQSTWPRLGFLASLSASGQLQPPGLVMQGRRNNQIPVAVAWCGSNQGLQCFLLGEMADSNSQRGRKCSSCDGGASSIIFVHKAL
jgi:hypothetical protein